jgi:tripartite-type tricarboxylate transporter receptor subunit TctC
LIGAARRSKTPKPIVDKLRTVFGEVMKSPTMAQHLKTNGLSPYKSTIESFQASLCKEIQQKAE